MRTTLTLEDDVATALRRLAAKHKRPFKQTVNEVLRAGLVVHSQARHAARRAPYRIVPVSLGTPRLPDLDDVADVLSIAEGEQHG